VILVEQVDQRRMAAQGLPDLADHRVLIGCLQQSEDLGGPHDLNLARVEQLPYSVQWP
jgi:hypothetical protein